MNVAIRTLSINEAIAEALQPFAAKVIARKVETSERTVEHWKQAKTGPQAKHFVAMLLDDELRPRVLAAAGLGDLARSAETISHLMAALAQLKEDADGKQQRINELIYLNNDIRSGRVRTSGRGDGAEEAGVRPSIRGSGSVPATAASTTVRPR